jgi:hypothetical protein
MIGENSMRNILLAGAAMLVTTGMAMAAGSDTITVKTTLDPSCSVSITNALVSLPADGNASVSQAFSYQCNYATGNATIEFDSTFDGVSADEGVTTFAYNITPSTGAAGTSLAAFTNVAPVNPTVNTPTAATFTVDLVTPIVVAGVYEDVLEISITP